MLSPFARIGEEPAVLIGRDKGPPVPAAGSLITPGL
jgi:hypothetical protein